MKAEADEARRPGRPPLGPKVNLADWAERNYLGEGTVRTALAEALGFGDESSVSRCLSAKTSIEETRWQDAIQALIRRGDFNDNALLEFVAVCSEARTGAAQRDVTSLVRHFDPVQSRLTARLERGQAAPEALQTAFAEAGGLLASWLLQERQFTREQFKAGIPELVKMANRWMLIVDYLGADDPLPSESKFFERFATGEETRQAAHAAKVVFLCRLASWVKAAAPATRAEMATLLQSLNQQLWMDGQLGRVEEE